MFNLASRVRPGFGGVGSEHLLADGGRDLCALNMPSGVYPEVTFPRISVVAKVPALAVANMDVLVTQPLEQELSGVLGVAQVRSKTIRGGSELSLEFSPGTDMRLAESHTWNRIGAIRSTLPPDTDLRVEQMTPSVFPIMSVVLTGGDNPADLRDYAFYQLAPLIRSVPDVVKADVAGGNIREIVVEARPSDLLQHGFSCGGSPPIRLPAPIAMQPVRPQRTAAIGLSTRHQQSGRKRTQHRRTRHFHERQSTFACPRRGRRQSAPSRPRAIDRFRVGRDAVVVTIFRRPNGNTVNISRGIEELLGKKLLPANIQANGDRLMTRRNSVNTGRRQRARRHCDWRRVQHLDSLRVPPQLASHSDLRLGHSDDAGDHCVSVFTPQRRGR